LKKIGIKLKVIRENGVRDFATGAKVVKPNIYQSMEFVHRRLQFSRTISKESKRAAKYYSTFQWNTTFLKLALFIEGTSDKVSNFSTPI